jgi:uncharacterized membrane protein
MRRFYIKKQSTMKLIITFVVILCASTFAQAQSALDSSTDFALVLAQETLQLKPGEQKIVDLQILRNKGFKKSPAKLAVLTSLPNGVAIEFQPAEKVAINSKVTITVSPITQPGDYFIILNCKLQNQSKGTTLKLVVSEEHLVTSGH